MSLGRRRNVFTLTDFQTKLQETDLPLQRRLKSDPFERDPFKVHSYNFHYADRPIYPLKTVAHHTPNPAITRPFNTVFYNYDFATHRTDKENSSTNSFHEYRRRKFLHDYQTTAPNIYGGGSSVANININSFQQQSMPCSYQSTTPQTMHQFQFQSPYKQQQQSQQQQSQAELPNQQRCSWQKSVVDANVNTRYNANFCPARANQNETSGISISNCASNGGSTHSTANGRTQMSHYPTTSTTLTSIYQRDTSNRNSLSRLYGLSARNANCEQNKRSTAATPSDNGAVRYSGSRTSLDSLRTGSTAIRGGLPTKNGQSGSGGNFTGVLTNKISYTKIRQPGNERHAFNDVGSHNDRYGAGMDGLSQRDRRPLQVIYPPAQTLLNHTLKPKRSTTSGCEININIQNTDDTKGSDNNVTIKIETDTRSNRNLSNIKCNDTPNDNLYYARDVPLRFTSPTRQNNLNLLNASRSNETIVIDKHISKFSIVNEKDSVRNMRSRRRSQSLTSPTPHGRRLSEHNIFTAIKENNCCSGVRDKTNTTTRELKEKLIESGKVLEERMPTLLPWRLDTSIRECFNNGSRDNDFATADSFHPKRSSYDSCLKDLNNLKKYNNEQLAAMHSKMPSNTVTERKLLNTVSSLPQSNSHKHSKKLQDRFSSSLKHDSLLTIQSNRSCMPGSQLHLKHVAGTTSIGSSASKGSHQNLSQTPLKVNINVYTDQLKLLRI